jgi:hypothetical protein
LAAFFKEHGNPDGDVAKLDLRVAAAVPGLPAPVSLSHPVVATLQYEAHPADMKPRFHVQWVPLGDQPLPAFAGALTVDSDEDYGSFFLVLDGRYEPPLGLAGQAFDAVVGHRIAESTADDLLARIRDYVEAAYRAEESGKPA